MKKNTLVLALSLALSGLASVSASAATVAGGNINFEGEVLDQTCLINGQTPNGGAIDLNVILESANVGDLSNAGATAKPTPFVITLGGAEDLNCANGKVASVSFDSNSPAVNNLTGWLNNTAIDNAAENVQIQILNGETNEVINLLSGNNNHAPKTIADHTAVYEYFGRYVAAGGPATAGKVASTVKYNIVYQ